MNRTSNNPVLVSLTGLIGLLGLASGCDGLMHAISVYNSQTFSLIHVVLWIYPLVALLLGATWLLVAWFVLIRAPRNTWVSLIYLLVGLFILAYPALYLTPALCCSLPDITAIQLAPTMYLYSSAGVAAVIGLVGLIFRRRW